MKIIALELFPHFKGKIEGTDIVFQFEEYPGNYYEPPEQYFLLLEGGEEVPADDEEYEKWEYQILDRIADEDYVIPEKTKKRYQWLFEEIDQGFEDATLAEKLLATMVKQRQTRELKDAIDLALDKRDKKQFMLLSNEISNLSM
ncbi:IDEAL domain-containing protein (plasmid) [Pontibacillus sp. ALD_SL1]|uniref:IDEAL domain-containing protein n=1 Tax=Pontibacillus sp. ALD_SL1 TaxID=2777185 RepID=UPI001A97720D|nr:IDEAL domain-containing protein [Pontibacillus sp. ALD_SL1]QST02231.1 IDEAL domain-containing protein [Pontibacillus sp. ALD_SL1]